MDMYGAAVMNVILHYNKY